MRNRWWKVGAIALATMMLASCAYYTKANEAEQAGPTRPWWCNPTEEIPVTEGPAAGSVDYYANVDKAPLPWADCKSMSLQFDIAKAYALQWPTAGAAVAAGWRMATPYVPGMGTHHIRGGITPEMLADPSFNRLNPNLDSAGLDSTFDPIRPEVLQYDGNGPDAKLVGFDYYVRTDTGQPPEGFPQKNDWWHIHPWICFRTTDAHMVGFNTSDANCTAMNGINVNMANFYMLHVWVLDDMTFEPDVFAGMIPCISGGTAIHDPNHMCHKMRGDMAAMDHSM
jgi:hypothetical protein